MTHAPVHDTPPAAQPWTFWRTRPAEAFGAAEIAAMTALLDTMAFVPDGGWRRAADGDAAVAIRLALRLLPIGEIAPRVDIVMTALARCAAAGNPAAALVLAKLLRRAPLDGALAGNLAASWLARNLVRMPAAKLHICDLRIDAPAAARGTALFLLPSGDTGGRRA